MSFQSTALLLSWLAILLLSMVVAGLVRQVHALGRGPASGAPPAATGPAPGSAAPGFERFGPGLLLFLSADCGACTDVLAEATGLGRPVTALFSGSALPADGVTVHADEAETFERYRIPATPFAVIVGASGRVQRAEPVGSARALRELTELEGAR